MPPRLTLALALGAALLSHSVVAARASPPVARNEQAPVHLSWMLFGELNLPGIGGARAQVSAWLPGLPLHVAGQVAYSYGLEPDHAAGTRDEASVRAFTSTLTLDATVGWSFEGWSLDEEEVDFIHNVRSFGSHSLWNVSTYEVGIPSYRRYTPFVGIVARLVPGAESCAASGPRPADCAESAGTFLTLGYEHLRARRARFATVEHGELIVENLHAWSARLMYNLDGGYTRPDALDRIGAELVWWFESDIGGRLSFGYDGKYLLVTAGLGGGASYSFAGEPRPTARIGRD